MAGFAQPKVPAQIGVLDEAKLAATRSDFPSLVSRVLPQIVTKRHLTLVVSKQGLRWDATKLPRVDVTADALSLLQKLPPTAGALTASQANGARQALNALDGLKVATTLGGMDYDDYNTRLTNASIAFSTGIRTVPEGALRTQLTKGLQGFIDAKAKWDYLLKLLEVKTQLFDINADKLRELTPESGQAALSFKQKAEREQMIQETYQPLLDLWKQAGQEVDTAQTLMPPST